MLTVPQAELSTDNSRRRLNLSSWTYTGAVELAMKRSSAEINRVEASYNSILREFFSIFRARQGYFARRESRIFWFDNLRRFHRPNPVSLARGVDLRLPQNLI
jgi:hypothetical protein